LCAGTDICHISVVIRLIGTVGRAEDGPACLYHISSYGHNQHQFSAARRPLSKESKSPASEHLLSCKPARDAGTQESAVAAVALNRQLYRHVSVLPKIVGSTTQLFSDALQLLATYDNQP
jgi:hypothetical protein